MEGEQLNSSLSQLNWLIHAGPRQHVGKRKQFPEKPPYSYSALIKMAIDSKKDKSCTLHGIYQYISDNFAYYQTNCNPTWKNSVRHNLSMNKQFRKIEKAKNEKVSRWEFVDVVEKKKKVLTGPGARINPAALKIYDRMKQEKETIVLMEEEATTSMLVDPLEELGDTMLFSSVDLSSSFLNVYNQVVHNRPSKASKQDSQIDWMKIGMETAGMDFRDETDPLSIDTGKFQEFLDANIPSSNDWTPEISPESNTSTLTPGCNEKEEVMEDEFDWNSIL